MRRHARTRCPQCKGTFSRPSDLNRHMKIHASEEEKEELMLYCPYIVCLHKTLQKSNLMTHINTHTGERPHKCPEEGCGFSTGDPGSLNRHRKSIHGYEPRECSSGSHGSATTRMMGRQRGRWTASSSSSRSASSLQPSPSSEGGSPGSPISAATRSAARQWRRYNPYTTAPSSRSKPPLEPFPPSSLSVTEGHVKQGPRNTLMAYGTELVTNLTQPSGSQNVVQGNLPFNPGLFSTSDALAAEYSHLTVPEQGEVCTAHPVCDMAVTEEVFDNFLSRFNDSQPVVPSLLPATISSNVNNTPAFTPATLPAAHVNYAASQYGDLLTPSPSSLLSDDVQHPVDSVSHDYASAAMSPNEWYSQPTSFVTPDMGAHSQDIAAGYSYPSSAGTTGFAAQGLYSV